MNCSEFLDFVNSYLDDELEEQARAEVEAHLADCPDCNNEAADWQTYLQWLRHTFPEQTPPAELWEKIHAGID
jgi:anti-sigma factor RsiW